MQTTKVEIVDSHTGGEPTRVVVAGGPSLGEGPLSARKERFRRQHDDFRSTLMREPRGNEVIVGALLCEPHEPGCDVGVIYFNNVGYIGMCGHGTIGLVTTLHDLERVEPGLVRIDTPVGPIEAELHRDRSVSVTNVISYRFRADVALEVEGYGSVTGDIAWGGNWFFLVKDCPLDILPENIPTLRAYCQAIRNHLDAEQIGGENGGQIDHIELYGPPTVAGADSKNFVLCPGGEFDRSPCGTGTSAKIACLFADGKLKAGQLFRQESIIGSVFEASFEVVGDREIIPTIRGRAHIHSVATLRMEREDPFRLGIEI
ncbi:MAG: proline racemase family protein [Planctomycetota bacterium]|nr:proline racemase family protein [Planctomycetota bacterium]